MKTVRCDDDGLAAAAAVLTRGGVVVIPTDTVYGLAAHPDFPAAVERLYTIKGREAKKPIALLAADAAAARRFGAHLPARAAELASTHWPGALTLVLPILGDDLGADASLRRGEGRLTTSIADARSVAPQRVATQSAVEATALGGDASLRRQTRTFENSTLYINQDILARSDKAYFSPCVDTNLTNGDLPHWHQSGRLQFVTFRLADSLPHDKYKELQEEKERILSTFSEPPTAEQEDELFNLMDAKLEKYLNDGYGECVLKNPNIRRILEDALFHFDGNRYRLHAFVIMPNHVHLLIEPLGDNKLKDILHSLKSFSANEINKLLDRNGALWQKESFDRIIRNAKHYHNTIRYIGDNPKALGVTNLGGADLGADASLRRGEGRLTTSIADAGSVAPQRVAPQAYEGFRVPDHDWTRRLLAACGGVLRVTSANLSGQRPATDAPQALADVGLSADLVVDDGVSPGGVPSAVVRVAQDNTLTILRDGGVGADASLRRGEGRLTSSIADARSVAPQRVVPHPFASTRTKSSL